MIDKLPADALLVDVKALPENPVETNDDGLGQMNSTTLQLALMKTHLDALINTLEDNPSLLNHLALFWGELALWFKIILVIALTAAMVAVGVLIHTAAFIVGAAMAVILSLLEDHYQSGQRSTSHLKEGVANLAGILELTITALDEIRQGLTVALGDLKQENATFTQNNLILHAEITSLHAEITAKITELTHMGDALSQVHGEFSETCVSLSGLHEKLAETTTQYQRLNAAFDHSRHAMAGEIVELRAISETCKQYADSLLKHKVKDEEQHQRIQASFDGLLSNMHANFKQVVESFSQEGQAFAAVRDELVHVKAELQESRQRYEELNQRHQALNQSQQAQLDRQRAQLDRHEKLVERLEEGITAPTRHQTETSSNVLSVTKGMRLFTAPKDGQGAPPPMPTQPFTL